jgi:hypothetical protein
MSILQDELLSRHAVAVAGPSTQEITAVLEDLGARVHTLPAAHGSDEEDVGRWASEHSGLRAVVYDARSSFGGGGPEALARTVLQAWLAAREVAVGALIEGTEPGKVVLVGPAGDAGPQAEAARAALESLARTLSVEWARYGITTVMLAPSAVVDEARLAELVAFLCSPAGDYVSGCRLEVGRLGAP